MSDSKQGLIVVFGATGAQGGSVARALVKEGKFKVRGITRHADSDAAKALKAQGVEVVAADLAKKDTLVKAVEGAWGVFGVTQFWQKDIMSNPQHELEQGKNLVDACVEAKVNYLIVSVLDDVKTATEGRLEVPHFTNKNLIEQYARKSKIPRVAGFYPGFYATNLANFHNVSKAADGVFEFGFGHLRADVALPVFVVDDTGIYVSQMFNQPDRYAGKNVRTGIYTTFPELAQTFQCVTGKPARFRAQMTKEEAKKGLMGEVFQMLEQFNTVGYYLGADISQHRKEFPGVHTFEGFLWQSGYQGPADNKKA
jgi:uncharacterized protein YbjT (DUF2867 family)